MTHLVLRHDLSLAGGPQWSPLLVSGMTGLWHTPSKKVPILAAMEPAPGERDDLSRHLLKG